MLAAIADQQRQPAQAEAFYRACLKKTTPQTEALVYGGLLRVLWQEHKYDDIVAICQAGLRKAEATNHILFHSDLARAWARLNKLDEALKEAEQAVKLATETNRLALQGLRIRLLTQAGKLDQAQKEGEALLEKYDQPGDIVDVRYLLSHIYTQAGQFVRAEDQLQLILKVDPTSAVACNDLGYLWADQGKNLVEAESLIRKALELDRQQRSSVTSPTTDPAEDNPAYIDSLGWVLFRRGKIQEAREQLERAARMPDGDDPVIWDHLGDVYYRLELPEQAFQAWQRALTMYEEHNLRPRDQRYRDLQQKVEQLKTATPGS
jgi:tetratricopeptide (TPR) repeat protein